jgi:pimeloyl-ACP methyl ester carboxylesterase
MASLRSYSCMASAVRTPTGTFKSRICHLAFGPSPLICAGMEQALARPLNARLSATAPMWPRRALALPPAILVGHSMGCRVVIEAALQAPGQTAGVILVDGSQLAAAMEGVLKERFATPDGYTTTVNGLLQAMFTAKSDKTVAASIIERAGRLPRSIGEKYFTDMARYDAGRLTSSLASLRVPVMALQTTFLNEKSERMSLREGQTTPYMDAPRQRSFCPRGDHHGYGSFSST